MKALIQRVLRGSVTVEKQVISRIDEGYVVFLGVRREDTEDEARFLANKTAALRICPDAQGLMNRSIMDTGGHILVVSQFTLHADTHKGNRPSFIQAAPAEQAKLLYETYISFLKHIIGPERVVTGQFQTKMLVDIMNDGPVTVELKSRNEYPSDPAASPEK